MTSRLLVLADTHIPRRARRLPDPVLDMLPAVDGIIHLGDFTQLEVAEMLEQFGDLHAVSGNNDCVDIRSRFPLTQRLDVDGHRIVLLHGDVGGRTALEAARSVRAADAVLFGHSHRPWCSREAGTLLFNPGSPTDRRWAPRCSFGILTIGRSIDATLIRL